MDETDDELAALARGGDRAAFESLVRRTGRLVFASLRPDCRSSHEAEDLTQETFLLAYRRIESLADPAKFRPWLLAIGRSVRVDSRRRGGRLKRTPVVTVSSTTSPADRIEEIEQQERALAALRSMPETYRLPLALRYLTGADHDTIGKQLGLTNGSLRGLLHRGLSMLRERMKE